MKNFFISTPPAKKDLFYIIVEISKGILTGIGLMGIIPSFLVFLLIFVINTETFLDLIPALLINTSFALGILIASFYTRHSRNYYFAIGMSVTLFLTSIYTLLS